MLRKRKHDAGDDKYDGPKPAPSRHKSARTSRIVERVNALPFSQFIQDHGPSMQDLSFSPKSNEPPIHDHASSCSTSTNYQIIIKRNPSCSLGAAHDEQLATRPTPSELQSCLDMIESTSADAYSQSTIGWHPTRKLDEMNQKDMLYLLVRYGRATTQATLTGFASFMITYEDARPVVYLYEIHLRPEARGTGLGRHLLTLIENVASSTAVERVMLTCFRSNRAALDWYSRLGYARDEYSPSDKLLRGGKVKRCDYLILSRSCVDIRSPPRRSSIDTRRPGPPLMNPAIPMKPVQ